MTKIYFIRISSYYFNYYYIIILYYIILYYIILYYIILYYIILYYIYYILYFVVSYYKNINFKIGIQTKGKRLQKQDFKTSTGLLD